MVGKQEDPLPPPPLRESGEDKTSKRKPRSDKGQIRFNFRDQLALKWIGQQYAVRLDTLQTLLGCYAHQVTKIEKQLTESTALRIIARWQQEQFVERRKILSGEPQWVWLTAQGLRQMGLPYKPKALVVSQLRHLHLVNRIRLKVETRYQDFQAWRGERQMRYEHWNDKEFHVPDGEVITTKNDVIAVEIERTLKSRRRIDDIVKRLDRDYGKVWYFVTAETRSAVEAATAKQRDKFRLLDLEKYLE